MQPPAAISRLQSGWHGLWAFWRFGRHASVDQAGVGLLGYRSVFYRSSLARYQGTKVLLWETTYDSLLPTYARAAGFRIIALPHNLEALVSGSAFSDPRADKSAAMAAEFQRLGLADTVYTISKEEQWLLDANGVTAHYLPFYPDESLADECAHIRTQRSQQTDRTGSVAGPLLILGSAFNPATGRGMGQQLSWLASNSQTAPPVVVAGPQTDGLLAHWASPQVRILGAVTREKLIELLQSCSALLIHTEGGAGAVTRIPEALLAGLPVIANRNAARDQHGTPGVHVYDHVDEFQTLVRTPLPMPPALPRPVGAEGRFQKDLFRLQPPAPPDA